MGHSRQMKNISQLVLKRSKSKQPKLKLKILSAALLLSQTFLTALEVQAKPNPNSLSYSELIQEINQEQVVKVQIDESNQKALVTLKGQSTPKRVSLFERNPELIARLRSKNVEFDVNRPGDNAAIYGLLTNLLFLFLLIGFLMVIVKRSANASGQAMNFAKSKARFQIEAKTGITFQDVAGIEEAKEELEEVITFLKQPEKFTAIGAKIPKGVLLIGPPGTGKTLLAKAIAGEAGVPFFSISGSEFVEMFVGVGASRVRDLFKKAKENAPCLIFIDEIDAVGRQRGVGYGGGNDEREQTLNQMLTEMDGFEGNTGIIVIAATNRPDVLDVALLRPGRFDRQVTVDYPDFNGRKEILEVHARNKKMDPEISLEMIARRTPGFTGADLANLLNEAAILTGRRRKEAITMVEVNDAIDRVVAGMEGTPLVDSKSKRLIAYHEIGHALIGSLYPGHRPLEKVTLIPRGRAAGLTWFTPSDEQGLTTRSELLAQVAATLGGRVAEEIVFGHDEVTTGALSDIEKVTTLVRDMVTRLGMSDLGLVALEHDNNNSFLGYDNRRGEYSEDVAASIDLQIRALVMQCYNNAHKILENNRPLMDHLVDILIEQETIEGDHLREIIESYQKNANIPASV